MSEPLPARARGLAACAALALLGACAGMNPAGSLAPGASEDRVREVMGRPDAVVALPQGGAVWQYPRGPSGQETWMATFGPDARLKQIEQVLVESTFARIQPGVSRAEVERLLGRPGEKARYPGTAQEVWTWRYLEGGATNMQFHVHFDLQTGQVATTRRGIEQRAAPG